MKNKGEKKVLLYSFTGNNHIGFTKIFAAPLRYLRLAPRFLCLAGR
jgi:hypothetical protein